MKMWSLCIYALHVTIYALHVTAHIEYQSKVPLNLHIENVQTFH